MEPSDNSMKPRFIVWLTLALIAASIYLFSPYLKYLLVAAVLALSTSHAFVASVNWVQAKDRWPDKIKRHKRFLISLLFTAGFLVMIFTPLLYFITMTLDQVSGLQIEEIKQTALELWHRFIGLTNDIPLLDRLFTQLKTEGTSLINSGSIEAVLKGGQNLFTGVSGLLIQIGWILIFYFLFNLYGATVLNFLATLLPTSDEHEHYLYKECTGTVAVVFYGSLFNMVAQGVAFGLLLAVVGGYDSLYLGVLAGFCSIIPLVGAALVYVPVVALEIMQGNYLTAVVILAFTLGVMGFLIDNFMRLFFIANLKKLFGFEYAMNEVLILLSILAGISTLGFWGLVIGPSVIALTLAAANICRDVYGEGESSSTADD